MEPFWRMTRERVWGLGHGEMLALWRIGADHVRAQAGTGDFQGVVDHYSAKYGLPRVPVLTFRQVRERVEGLDALGDLRSFAGGVSLTMMAAITTTTRDGRPGTTYIAYSPGRIRNADEALVTLRHEVEHVRDHAEGFLSAVPEPVVYDRATRSVRIVPGHHRRYALFDYEYPHVVCIRRALEAGEDVPDEVLEGYPALAAAAAERDAGAAPRP